MNSRLRGSLTRQLRQVRRLDARLSLDVALAEENLRSTKDRYDRGEIADVQELYFAIRSVIRTFFSRADALSFSLRRSVLLLATKAGLNLNNEQRAKLSEMRWDRDRDLVTDRFKKVTFRKNLNNASRYFPQLFGTNFAKDHESANWKAFKELIIVRNRITHPTEIENLFPIEALTTLSPGMAWFYDNAARLFRCCGEAVGIDIGPEPLSRGPEPLFRPSDFERLEVDTDFYKEVGDSGARSIAYAHKVLELLGADTRRAWALATLETDGKKSARLTDRSQFGWRLLYLSLFSELEGLTAVIRFYTRAAVGRGQVVLSSAEEAALGERDVCLGFAGALSTWSTRFGYSVPVKTSGPDWDALVRAHQLRERITHPKSTDSLRIRLREAERAVHARGWLVTHLECLKLDTGKWE